MIDRPEPPPVAYPGWARYESGPQSTVVGTLLVADPIAVPALRREVELLAWLPVGHQAGRRYPVIYMHDGANLFDEAASYSGEWCVDETMTALGLEAVVVGIPNAGDDRRVEYCPWPSHLDTTVRGAAYAGFVVDTVKPFVERTLPVARGRDAVGVMGSSLGGLISLFLWLEYPDEFGFVGSMSTAAWFTPGLWRYLDRCSPPTGRVYLDVGTDENPADPAEGAAYVDSYRRLTAWFRSHGFGDRDLMTVVDEGAIHHEREWSRRLPAALEFLLRGTDGPLAGS